MSLVSEGFAHSGLQNVTCLLDFELDFTFDATDKRFKQCLNIIGAIEQELVFIFISVVALEVPTNHGSTDARHDLASDFVFQVFTTDVDWHREFEDGL